MLALIANFLESVPVADFFTRSPAVTERDSTDRTAVSGIAV